MQIDGDALSFAAECLRRAAYQVVEEPRAPSVLGSEVALVDGAHAAAGSVRAHTLARIGELLRAQAEATAQTAVLFRTLDAQVAATISG